MSETSNESWDGLLTNYLKASSFKGEDTPYICIGVPVKDNSMALELEESNDKFVFSLNVTNKVFLKNHGIAKPKDAIGKKIYFKIVPARNPNTKVEVDSLRITKVE